MSEPRTLRCHDDVPLPFRKVRDALRHDALGILQRATQSAAARAGELGVGLHAGWALSTSASTR